MDNENYSAYQDERDIALCDSFPVFVLKVDHDVKLMCNARTQYWQKKIVIIHLFNNN